MHHRHYFYVETVSFFSSSARQWISVSVSLLTSSDDSAGVCERPESLGSTSRPLKSAELVLLALKSSFKAGLCTQTEQMHQIHTLYKPATIGWTRGLINIHTARDYIC